MAERILTQRELNRASAMVQLTPTEAWAMTAQFWSQDEDYDEVPLGLTEGHAYLHHNKGSLAMYLLQEETDFLRKMEKGLPFRLELRDDPLLRPDEFKLVVKSAGRDVTQQYAVA